jgi:hypothetical protein
VLARYRDSHGRLREVLTRPGSGGSVLLIDRDAATRRDRRLVAHLGADEPPANAALTCRHYLSQPRHRFCRPLTPEDLRVTPFAENLRVTPHAEDRQRSNVGAEDCQLLDSHHRSYRLLPCSEGIAVPELRWHCLQPLHQGGDPRPLRLRAVIAALQRYEPVRTLTARAVVRHRLDSRLSIAALRDELERMDARPIVLNRALREAVLEAIAVPGVSLNELAIRCGRFKHDPRGNRNTYGDTSWLARRVGLLPNAGKTEPTPWIHSDVLALIARRGLGISPREVEV